MQTVEIIDRKSASSMFLKGVFFTPASRYSQTRFALFGSNRMLTLETYDRVFNPVRDANVVQGDTVRYYSVTTGTQCKPWLISQSAYGDSGYWWAIMEYNNIFDVEEIVIGLTLKIPPLSVLPIGE